jgi:pheromone shutdown protein TraB
MIAVLLLSNTGFAGLRTPLPRTQTTTPDEGAILRFVDCKTQQTVVLVGSMHYNPHSISLAASAVQAEAEAGTLRAVVVESCPTRWNSTLKMQPAGSFLRGLFDNEMQAAAEVAESYGCSVALGDQAIEDTGRRIAQVAGATLVEAFSPFAGASTL